MQVDLSGEYFVSTPRIDQVHDLAFSPSVKDEKYASSLATLAPDDGLYHPEYAPSYEDVLQYGSKLDQHHHHPSDEETKVSKGQSTRVVINIAGETGRNADQSGSPPLIKEPSILSYSTTTTTNRPEVKFLPTFSTMKTTTFTTMDFFPPPPKQPPSSSTPISPVKPASDANDDEFNDAGPIVKSLPRRKELDNNRINPFFGGFATPPQAQSDLRLPGLRPGPNSVQPPFPLPPPNREEFAYFDGGEEHLIPHQINEDHRESFSFPKENNEDAEYFSFEDEAFENIPFPQEKDRSRVPFPRLKNIANSQRNVSPENDEDDIPFPPPPTATATTIPQRPRAEFGPQMKPTVEPEREIRDEEETIPVPQRPTNRPKRRQFPQRNKRRRNYNQRREKAEPRNSQEKSGGNALHVDEIEKIPQQEKFRRRIPTLPSFDGRRHEKKHHFGPTNVIPDANGFHLITPESFVDFHITDFKKLTADSPQEVKLSDQTQKREIGQKFEINNPFNANGDYRNNPFNNNNNHERGNNKSPINNINSNNPVRNSNNIRSNNANSDYRNNNNHEREQHLTVDNSNNNRPVNVINNSKNNNNPFTGQKAAVNPLNNQLRDFSLPNNNNNRNNNNNYESNAKPLLKIVHTLEPAENEEAEILLNDEEEIRQFFSTPFHQPPKFVEFNREKTGGEDPRKQLDFATYFLDEEKDDVETEFREIQRDVTFSVENIDNEPFPFGDNRQFLHIQNDNDKRLNRPKKFINNQNFGKNIDQQISYFVDEQHQQQQQQQHQQQQPQQHSVYFDDIEQHSPKRPQQQQQQLQQQQQQQQHQDFRDVVPRKQQHQQQHSVYFDDIEQHSPKRPQQQQQRRQQPQQQPQVEEKDIIFTVTEIDDEAKFGRPASKVIVESVDELSSPKPRHKKRPHFKINNVQQRPHLRGNNRPQQQQQQQQQLRPNRPKFRRPPHQRFTSKPTSTPSLATTLSNFIGKFAATKPQQQHQQQQQRQQHPQYHNIVTTVSPRRKSSIQQPTIKATTSKPRFKNGLITESPRFKNGLITESPRFKKGVTTSPVIPVIKDEDVPPPTDIITVLIQNNLTEMASLLMESGLDEKLLSSNEGPFTVFAPTNVAFKRFTSSKRDNDKHAVFKVRFVEITPFFEYIG